MTHGEFLRHLVDVCERLGLDYFLTGSVASSIHGEPRLTHDIDVVIRFRPGQLPDFIAAFPQDRFYLSEEAAEQAMRNASMFNILDKNGASKIDVIIPTIDPFNRSRFERTVRQEVEDRQKAAVAAPEDVILSKLVFYKEGGSEKHIRDCTSIVQVQRENLDFDYLAEWAYLLDVSAAWKLILQKVRKQTGPEGLPGD